MYTDNRKLFYFLWFAFYILLFGLPTMFIIVPFYAIGLLFAFSPVAESLWRAMNGVRPLRLRQEKKRLLPLFQEVYRAALETNKEDPISEGINLYIQENMDINAFAFGKQSLVLTRGSIELLSDECLKGMMAHEFGHFANGDTKIALIASIGNLPLTFLIKFFSGIKKKLDEASKNSFVMSLFKGLFDAIYYLFKLIEFIGDLIIMYCRRKSEYEADYFAYKCGYGVELGGALSQIYATSISKPQSVKEQMRGTHPHVTKRIEALEGIVD